MYHAQIVQLPQVLLSIYYHNTHTLSFYASSGLHEPCCAVGPAILCQKFSFFSNCHVATLCMHKGIMIERNLLENSLILEKKTYFLLKYPSYLLKKNPLDLKLKCGTLDGLKAHLCSLIMLLPGMPNLQRRVNT